MGRRDLVRPFVGRLLDAEPPRVRRPAEARPRVPGAGAAPGGRARAGPGGRRGTGGRPASPQGGRCAAGGGAGPGERASPFPAASAGPPGPGPGLLARVVLATLAWLVPGLALAAAGGLPDGLVATLPLQMAGVAGLAVAPRAAWAALGGAVVLVFSSIPIVAVVVAVGGSFAPGGPAPGAAVILAALAWLGGLGIVGSGRAARYPWRAPA